MVPRSLTSSAMGPTDLFGHTPGLGWPRNVSVRTAARARAVAVGLILLLGFVAAIGFVRVKVRGEVVSLRKDLLATEEVLQKLELEGRELLAQVERLNRSDRIARVASSRLGLQRPAPHQEAILP